MRAKLATLHYGFDIDIGTPESRARLVSFDLLDSPSAQGAPLNKALELSIADTFVEAQRLQGCQFELQKAASLTSEGNGDFVCRTLENNSELRVEVVRHVNSSALEAQDIRRKAMQRLGREFPECLAPFSHHNLRLSDDLPVRELPSLLPDIARRLFDFSPLLSQLPDNVLRTRIWRHVDRGTLTASVCRAQGTGHPDWRPMPVPVEATWYESRLAKTIEAKLAKNYEKPGAAGFELLVWSTSDFFRRDDPAAKLAATLLSQAEHQPFDRVWLMVPLPESAELTQLWP